MKKNKKEYRYLEDDAYLYADKSNGCEIGLVVILATVSIIGFILYKTFLE